MTSVVDIEECPKCKGDFHTSFQCRTGEEYNFCIRCGFTQYSKIRLNDKGEWVREDVEYPLDGSVVFGVEVGGKLVWEKPILKEYPQKELELFLRTFRLSDQPDITIPDWIKPIIHLSGFRNIFHKSDNGEIIQLCYIGNWFRFEKDERRKLHFYLEKAVWDVGEENGNGMMLINDPDGGSIIYTVKEKTIEEALKMWDDLHEGKTVEAGEYLTWFDPEAGVLQCLRGEMPPATDDELMIPDEQFINEEEFQW